MIFPPIGELENELVLERWLPWDQVHPPEEDELPADEGSQP